MENPSVLSTVIDQLSLLTNAWINFADRAGVTTLPSLSLRPEQTMHHSPVCLWAKQQGGFSLCVKQKDKSLTVLKHRHKSISAVCPHGLWDLAQGVWINGNLVGVFYGGGWTKGPWTPPKTTKPYRGSRPPSHTLEKEQKLRQHLVLLAELMQALLEAAQQEGQWPMVHKTPEQMVASVEEILRTRYPEELTVELVATQLTMNTHYLGQLILRHTGKTFRQKLLEYRLHAAKGVLLSKFSVREVASKVGFSDPNYFTAAFSKAEGCSPKKWVQKNKPEVASL